MARREGKCLCGTIRFAAEVEREDYGACHCSICRRWAGGPSIEAMGSSIEFIEGEPTIFRSSEWGERLFCPACGTHIAYRNQDGSFLGINPMIFDPPLTGKFTMEVFIDDKPDTYAFVGDHPRLTGAEVMELMAPGSEGNQS